MIQDSHRFFWTICLIAGLAIEVRAAAPDFNRDVIPALTKLGCNGGACHGAFSGRGGFRLSLWGFDPQADFRSLVLEGRGRRIQVGAPEQSLLLLKPTMAMPHGGGRRLAADVESYAMLRDWLTYGAPGPVPNAPHVVRIDVQPPSIISADEAPIPLHVKAVWSDGVERDITRWALYSGNADHIASVSAEGLIQGHGPGRAVINVAYQGQVAAVPVIRPFAAAVQNADFPRGHFIDKFVAADWDRLGLQPAPISDDAEFLRRVSLDLIGTLPTVEEARAFLKSTSPDKRTELIDALLQRPEYADYWALKWSDLLRIHRRALGEKGLASFNGWLREALRNNRPFNHVVTELLTAQGNLFTSGPVAFYFVDQTPAELAETTAQIFLGVRMQCAKCHHHPFEVWSQDDYYGLAAFFSRIKRKDTREAGRYGGAQAIQIVAEAPLTHPDTGVVVRPRLLGATEPVSANVPDERQLLAAWLVDAKNPFFAKNIVNRYWGALVGRGLIEPIDDLRATNPASHPELLTALADDFVAHGYDMKHLLRTICTSRAYQLASEVTPSRDQDGMFVTHHRPKRLSAEVLLDAIGQATGTTETFVNFPAGTRAVSLPDPAVPSSFLDTFGRPLRVSACECARSSRADLRQVLNLSNGEALHNKICGAQGRVAAAITNNTADAAVIEEFYLATLTRLPTADETNLAQRHLASAVSRKEGIEDLLWTLLNVAEFSYNH